MNYGLAYSRVMDSAITDQCRTFAEIHVPCENGDIRNARVATVCLLC